MGCSTCAGLSITSLESVTGVSGKREISRGLIEEEALQKK